MQPARRRPRRIVRDLRTDSPLAYDRLSDPILVRRAKDGDAGALEGRCLADLPEAQATVVALKDAFDFPFEEISTLTGLPVGTAKCYAHRGRSWLRESVAVWAR